MTRDARHRWLEHLSSQECWEHLSATSLGRLAVIVGSDPQVFPVNFGLDGPTVVFRSEPGGKLTALERNPSVCLEIDGLDIENGEPWSVLVKGRAEPVRLPAELERLAGLSLPVRAVAPGARWMRITPSEVTGRRVVPDEPDADLAAAASAFAERAPSQWFG